MTPFRERVSRALQDTGLQSALAFATRLGRQNRASAFGWLDAQGMKPEELRDRAHQIKMEVLDDLDRWLDTLESNVKANGGHVYRAATGDDACRYVTELAKARGVRSVVKSKSMATEEIELNEAFARAGAEVLETDLGEFIIQMAREKPSHIIVPAIHKSKQDVARLFHEIFGTDPSMGPAELTAVAREKLRSKFLCADMGVSGANFAIAETGTLVVVENEGNARLTTTVPRLHVAVMGIEKVIRSWEDLQTLLPLLPASATGQKITSYMSLLNGPRQPDEAGGREEFHLVLLDAGRRRVHKDPVMREALACLRCGACLNACPVYGQIGGHAYGWVYPGPIGAVLGPSLRGFERDGDLPYASSLCGACLDACPVKIDIPRLLIHLRNAVNDARRPWERWIWRIWRWGLLRPGLYRFGAASMRRHARTLMPGLESPDKSFVEQWRKRKPSPSGRGWRETPGAGSKATETDRKSPHPPFGRPLPEGEGRRRFVEAARAVSITCIDSSAETVQRDIETHLGALGVRRIALDSTVITAPAGFEITADLAAADCGITDARWGIAATGTLVIPMTPRNRRTASLLPGIHIAILASDRILPDVPSALATVAETCMRHPSRPSSVVFITGPSRTADIELNLVLGVHGPKELHVFLI